MTYRVHLIHPERGDCGPILNGVTQRPASWPTRDAAVLYVEDCRAHGTWNSCRDSFAFDYSIREAKGEA